MFPFPSNRSAANGPPPVVVNPGMTWDANHKGSAALSNNNRDAVGTSTARAFVFSTGTKNAGKLYFEVRNLFYQKHYTGLASSYAISDGDNLQTYYSNSGSGPASVYEKGIGYDSTARKGSLVGVHVDFTARRAWFSVGGIQFQGDPATGTSGFQLPTGALYIVTGPNDTQNPFRLNTGQEAFAYPMASGYSAWGV